MIKMVIFLFIRSGKTTFLPYNIISLDEFYTPKNQQSSEEIRSE